MIFLTVVCVLLIAALVYTLRQNAEKEREWTRERQLLITRIQHPQVVPVIPGPDEEARPDDSQFMTSEPDDIDLVGTVQVGAPDGD